MPIVSTFIKNTPLLPVRKEDLTIEWPLYVIQSRFSFEQPVNIFSFFLNSIHILRLPGTCNKSGRNSSCDVLNFATELF